MRSVATIESILARLDRVSSDGISQPQISAAAAGTPTQPEKKTLKSDRSIESPLDNAQKADTDLIEVSEPPVEEPPDEDIGSDAEVIEVTASEDPIVPRWVDAVTVRLAPIPSSELEHIDDPKLDDAYETKLSWTGDDLGPLSNVNELVLQLLGDTQAAKVVSHSNGAAAAPARKVDIDFIRPKGSEDEPVEIPILSNAPTEDELIAYANALPPVRVAKRVFRATVVQVTRD
jgi:hypothetical protein